jgi:SAM-dependent methyltransferase
MSRLRTKKRELLDWEAMYRRGTPPWETGLPAQELMRIVAEQALRPGAALELGCGTGANAIYLSQNRFDVTAVDASPLALERARLRCEEAGGLVHFVLADVYDFAKNAGRFDLVFDVGLYHYARGAQLEQFLDMLWWVTHPGSYYLTLAGAVGGPPEDGDPPQVSEEAIRSELGRLFEFVHLRPIRFESPLCEEGFPGWSCLMRRPAPGGSP